MIRFNTYATVWKNIALNAVQITFVNRGTNTLFFSGKLLRFAMSIIFLLLIKNNVQSFARYTTDQLVIFFLTYHFLDLIAQIFYRGVYQFTPKIKSGEFDFALLRPINPLFQALAGQPDINDTIFLIPSLLITAWLLPQLSLTLQLGNVLWFLLLFLNGFLIVTGLHIFVLAAAILTVDVDGLIWMYRDLSRLGRFPISIYMEPLRFILFFFVPIGMMVTIPAEVLLGVRPSYSIFLAGTISLLFLATSLFTWKKALRKYASASS